MSPGGGVCRAISRHQRDMMWTDIDSQQSVPLRSAQPSTLPILIAISAPSRRWVDKTSLCVVFTILLRHRHVGPTACQNQIPSDQGHF